MLKEKMFELVEKCRAIENAENRLIGIDEIYSMMWEVPEIDAVEEEIAESIFEDISFYLGHTEKRHFSYVEYN